MCETYSKTPGASVLALVSVPHENQHCPPVVLTQEALITPVAHMILVGVLFFPYPVTSTR